MPGPTLAIVGRPNVGKSTLFNRLIGHRKALVRDIPGVTRDRLHGTCRLGRWQATVIDTGGLDPGATGLTAGVRAQVLAAIAEADALIFVVDGREGLTALDEEVAHLLHRVAKPVVVAANKVEADRQEAALGDVYRLGLQPVFPVSAEHGRGVVALLEHLAALLPAEGAERSDEPPPIRIAIVGRPNVGKSSLVNAIVGEERVVVHAEPGTTRDAVDTPVSVRGRPYLLVDTAGLRRKGRTTGVLDKLAAVMAQRSLERCDLALVVLDAGDGVTVQDLRIAGYAVEAGRGVLFVLNKWDAVQGADRGPELVRRLRDRLPALAHAPVVFTSARLATGLDSLFETLERVAADYAQEISTGELNRILGQATARRPPAGVRGKTLKVFYATQVSTRPPTFLLFVNDPAALHFSYERYLINALRDAFGLFGVPIRLRLRRRRAAPAAARRPSR